MDSPTPMDVQEAKMGSVGVKGKDVKVGGEQEETGDEGMGVNLDKTHCMQV